MWKKIAIAGCTGALIVGAGTAALAASGSSGSPSASPSTSTAAGPGAMANGKHRLAERALVRARNFEHGTWVTGNQKDSTTVTHNAIRGTVTAVSATSIDVKAKDGTTESFIVNADTKIHTRADHQGAAISAVKANDDVIVSGEGATNPVAKQIVDLTK